MSVHNDEVYAHWPVGTCSQLAGASRCISLYNGYVHCMSLNTIRSLFTSIRSLFPSMQLDPDYCSLYVA